MNKYHKIQGLYKRYTEGERKGKFIIGEYSKPEFELLKDIQWEWTEKIDGTNIRCALSHFLNKNTNIDFNLEFKGKTDKSEMPKHLLAKLQETIKKDNLVKIFNPQEMFDDICLYGEGYGYKIQNGCKYFSGEKEVSFILFDIKIGNTWLKREDIVKIADQLGIKVVPIMGEGTIQEALEFVEFAQYHNFKSKFGNFIPEGLVIRPKIELKDRRGYRIITKIKTVDFKEV